MKNLSDNEVIVLLVLVLATFLKVTYSTFTYFSKDLIEYNLGKNIYSFLHDTKTLYSSFIDIIYILVGVYFIFIRHTKNKIFIFGFSVLIFKAIIHLLVTYNLYKIFNLRPETEANLIKFKNTETLITNVVLFFLTLYILKVVFI